MIYLASLYSHMNRSVRHQRYLDAMSATIALLKAGKVVFSPIVYSHQLHEAGMGGDWETWAAFDEDMIRCCESLWVLTLDGWRESKGVAAEVDLATGLGKPIRHLTLEEALKGG